MLIGIADIFPAEEAADFRSRRSAADPAMGRLIGHDHDLLRERGET